MVKKTYGLIPLHTLDRDARSEPLVAWARHRALRKHPFSLMDTCFFMLSKVVDSTRRIFQLYRTSGVVGSGVSFALFQAFFFGIGQLFGGNDKEEDINFIQSQAMLKSLGFEEYGKNFRKSKLTDRTIPLLNERLGEVGTFPYYICVTSQSI